MLDAATYRIQAAFQRSSTCQRALHLAPSSAQRLQHTMVSPAPSSSVPATESCHVQLRLLTGPIIHAAHLTALERMGLRPDEFPVSKTLRSLKEYGKVIAAASSVP